MSTMAEAVARQMSLSFRRAAARFLFLAAGLFGPPPLFLAAVALADGRPHLALAAAAVAPLGAAAGWAGWLLWTDRRVPGWLVQSSFAAAAVAAAVALWLLDMRRESTVLASFSLLELAFYWWTSIQEPGPEGKPAGSKPKLFDDFA